MTSILRTPGLRLSTVLLAGLSLSIGWGIRGNFGHEYGAMIPGALTAVAVCLMSGREDWRRRVAYFAFFGALGWAFGGSISYMQVISYTHSGHFESQLHGFAGLFLIGALWAGLGGAGTALPAVMDRERLTALFRPLLWIFAVWWVWELFASDWIASLTEGYDTNRQRHKYPLYWFDADWTKAVTAILGILLFDFWDRRTDKGAFALSLAGGLVAGGAIHFVCSLANVSPAWPWWIIYAGVAAMVVIVHELVTVKGTGLSPMIVLGALGAGAGWIIQRLAGAAGLTSGLAQGVNGVFEAVGLQGPYPRYQGDLALFEQAQSLGIDHPSFTEFQRDLLLRYEGNLEAFKADLYTNWPAFYFDFDFPPHAGWVAGMLAGVALYFAIFGRFGSGSKLFLYMATGWLVGFLLLPVFLGVRMTPPRSDDWAGILGVYVATLIYLPRYQLAPVAHASIVSAIVGGVGFSGAAFLKLVMVRPGNPKAPGVTPEAIEYWSHWQLSNWHSFLEQSYGFINGIGIAVAMALLAPRVWAMRDEPEVRRWTEPFCVGFVLLFLVFVNWRKAVGTWVDQGAVPETMKMFWFESIELTAQGWFALVYWIVAAGIIILLIEHARGPRIPVVPSSDLGKGQLLFLVFLWVCVIFNFERALTGFSQGRLITEGVIVVNAIIATLLLLLFARRHDLQAVVPKHSAPVPYARVLAVGLIVAVGTVLAETAVVRALYGDAHAGHSGRNGNPQMRYGPDAEWKINPLLKTGQHN